MDFGLPEFGSGCTADPGEGCKNQDGGKVDGVCPCRDGMGFVAAGEATDVLFDQEFIDKKLSVDEIGRDVPGADDGNEEDTSDDPVFFEFGSELG